MNEIPPKAIACAQQPGLFVVAGFSGASLGQVLDLPEAISAARAGRAVVAEIAAADMDLAVANLLDVDEQISDVLTGILVQVLVRKALGAGSVGGWQFLGVTPRIVPYLHKEMYHRLQTVSVYIGQPYTVEMVLYEMVQRGRITKEEALGAARYPDNLPDAGQRSALGGTYPDRCGDVSVRGLGHGRGARSDPALWRPPGGLKMTTRFRF